MGNYISVQNSRNYLLLPIYIVNSKLKSGEISPIQAREIYMPMCNDIYTNEKGEECLTGNIFKVEWINDMREIFDMCGEVKLIYIDPVYWFENVETFLKNKPSESAFEKICKSKKEIHMFFSQNCSDYRRKKILFE